jgi:predicted phage-related endonuclease
MGHNAYKTAWELTREKAVAHQAVIDGRPLIPSEAGEAAYWGNVMEPVLAAEFTRRVGLLTCPAGIIMKNISWQFMLATPDYIVREGEAAYTLLELKTRSANQTKEWRAGVPEGVDDQCQHYLAVCGLDHMWVAVLLGGNHFEYYRVERNDAKIAYILAYCVEFWDSVLNYHSQKPTNGLATLESDADTSIEIPREPEPERNIVNLTPAVWEDVSYLARLKRHIRGLERTAAQVENRVKAVLLDAEDGLWEGRAVVSWSSVNSTRVDVTKLREEQPEIAKKYEVPMAARTFRILLKPEEIPDVHE